MPGSDGERATFPSRVSCHHTLPRITPVCRGVFASPQASVMLSAACVSAGCDGTSSGPAGSPVELQLRWANGVVTRTSMHHADTQTARRILQQVLETVASPA